MKKKVAVVVASLVAVSFLGTGCMCMHKAAKKAPTKVVVEQPQTTTQEQPVVKAITDKQLKVIFRDIHFNFNKYNLTTINKYGIKQNVPAVLDVMAEFMLKHPSIKIRVEGNCDERGTEEYNLALGEKRAKAAKEYLISQGVSPDRIETISYGKDRPLDPAHNEKAWAKNRRDHFVIIAR